MEIAGMLSLNQIQHEAQTVHKCLCFRINKEDLLKCIYLLRYRQDLEFAILTDLFAADFPGQQERFEVGYNLLSIKLNQRLVIKTQTAHSLDSIVKLHSSAGWYEREVFDLFGVTFDNHPDLRRILTDYNFQGHPLRKDFPLSGYVQVKYDQEQGKVVYEPVALDQEYRDFDYISPWK